MMKSDLVYLKHIQICVNQILIYTEGMSEDDFLKNQLVEDGVVRNFEIIGEATKKLSNDFRKKHPKIDWRGMAGMRDKLIHDYISVDYGIVWATVEDFLPLLKKELEEII